MSSFVSAVLHTIPSLGGFRSQRPPDLTGCGEKSPSGIGSQCRTTLECVSRSPNSVCYDGKCLCNLGYHFVASADQCIKDNTCPSCQNPVNTCLGGQDVYCNGTCFSNTGKRVHLDLIWIDLETGCGHSCDYIKVYDGCIANDSSNLLAFYTGDNAGNRQQVTSNCNKMLVHFHSDVDDENEPRAKRQVEADKTEPQESKTLELYLQKQQAADAGKRLTGLSSGDEFSSKDQRSGFMGYYREIDYDEKVCACANP
ncbi:unnamed protein product [Notodromas monacha]|uniref:CUB domain-containing protein n=1 Tax=Notodromas monacha TaxID=399045 RepID=A0A7R9BFY6_9CRUS|nr:unnamed protein product [Notodromas monacha]CAG0913769.1 unnamed protein product [Notodromas monacha]